MLYSEEKDYLLDSMDLRSQEEDLFRDILFDFSSPLSLIEINIIENSQLDIIDNVNL